jgi:hypothetical protein
MNDNEINISIAEACGWRVGTYGDNLVWYDPQNVAHPIEKAHRDTCLPNYCSDLNAMHEAEKSLTKKQTYLWCSFIDEACAFDGIHARQATARQRAEAFLRTLNLWKD